MKIAVVRLENWINVRVDRILYTLSKSDNEIYYIAPSNLHTDLYGPAIDKTIKYIDLGKANLLLVRLNIEPYYLWIKRRVSRILKRIKPDIVYACNISAGKIVHELGYPMVLDDRELYSLKEYVIGKRGRGIIYQYTFGRKIDLYKKYEELVGRDHPVTTVSRAIAEYYAGLGTPKAYVVPNYPSKLEYDVIMKSFEELSYHVHEYVSLCYVGGYNDLVGALKHRNMKAFLDVLKEKYGSSVKLKNLRIKIIGANKKPSGYDFIETTGRVPHSQLIRKLIGCDHGLLVWPPNPYNKHVAPHKGYLYVSTGAVPIVTGDMHSYIDTIRMFNPYLIDPLNYVESVEGILKHVSSITYSLEERLELKRKTIEKAVKIINWDLLEDAILEALKKA